MSHDGRLGAAKLRRASAAVGVPFVLGFAWGQTWEVITAEDGHWYFHPGSGEFEPIPPEVVTHFSSCPGDTEQTGPFGGRRRGG